MFALKDYITSEDIKNLRKNLGLTQKEFASLVGTSKPTIERWEKENAKITGPIVLLSKMINDYPDYVNRLIIPEKEFPVRMFYMYKDDICTLIDVDDAKQLVRIKNLALMKILITMTIRNFLSQDVFQEQEIR